jgi:SET family sugar efflux transporter-like MFS transporter
MYTSSLPLYTIRELGLPSYTPGVLMGLVASMEIPVMLLSSRFAGRFGKDKLMLFAFVCGAIFYTGVFFADSFLQLLLLQVFNALFYGLFAGVGLSLMQELLPQRIGFTSAVYSNGFKVGVMIGATLTGLVAQFVSFRYANIGAAIASILAMFFIMAFRHYKHQQQAAVAS